MSRLWALLILAALPAGCAEAPKDRLFTLAAEPPAQGAPHGSGGSPEIASVRLPGAVDRRTLVVRTGPETLELRDNEQWAEPLEGMVTRVLAQDLAMRTQAARARRVGVKIVVAIDEFEADAQGRARLSGWWRSEEGGEAKSPRHPFAMTTSFAVGDDVQMVAALSRLLGMLADRIAALR